MGREIVSISVPIGSQEWHLIKQWQQDSNTNVSVNVCAALRDNGETVAHLDALKRKFATLGELLNARKHQGLSIEEWREFFV